MTQTRPQIVSRQQTCLPGPPSYRCPSCQSEHLTKLITKTSNRNGNANRPYLKCSPCNKFVTFLDERGEHSVNPGCDRHRPSRLQVASFHKGRKLHFVCSTGQCTFYEEPLTRKARPITLTEELVEELAWLKLIREQTTGDISGMGMRGLLVSKISAG